MKLTLLSSTIALLMAPSIASADSYQGELDLNYAATEKNEDSTGQIGFKWYFKPVTTSFKKMFKDATHHPLAEAAFLEKASSLSVRYRKLDFENIEDASAENLDLGKFDIDLLDSENLGLSTSVISLDYFIPDTIFYVGVQYYQTNINSSSEEELKNNNWGLTGGLMLADNWLISTSYIDDKDYNFNLNSKYVVKLNSGAAVNFLASYTRLTNKQQLEAVTFTEEEKEEEKNLLTVSADYYFNNTFSIGVGFFTIDKTGYEFRTKKFFTDKFSGELSFITFDDINTASLGVSVRL